MPCGVGGGSGVRSDWISDTFRWANQRALRAQCDPSGLLSSSLSLAERDCYRSYH